MLITLDPKRHTKPLSFFLVVNRREVKWLVFNSLFYSAGSASVFISSYFLGRAIDALSLAGGQPRYLLWLVVIFLVGYELFYRFGHMCEIVLLSRVRAKVKKTLFDHTASLSYGYFTERFAGEIAHKIAVTADAFERMVAVITNGFIESSVLVLLVAVAFGGMHPLYVLFVAVWTIIFIFGSLLLARQLHKRASAYASEDSKTTGKLVDTYSNIGMVKVYGRQDDLRSVHRQVDAESKAFRSMGVWDIVIFNFQGVSIVILSIGLMMLTANLYGRGLVSVGQIVFVAATALRLFGYIWEMGKNLAIFIRYRGEAIQNLADLVVPSTVLDGTQLPPVREDKVGIEYRNVGFGYDAGRPVLNDLSLTIQAGQKVGIVGLSGAGKTTFVNLLLRFFDPQNGSILFNNADTREVSQEYLRSHISFIPQDTSLFHATVAENIAYGSSGVSRDDVKRAAALAYADEFIQALPEGYESIVGDRGVKLSGGQRQRIAIARALLADRPLFLLDEATSALDSDSEAKIQKGLVLLMQDKTVIAIAHRLSTLAHMDRIIFLAGGQILEDGTHEALLKLEGSYAKLWHMQAGGFLPSAAE